MRAQPFWYYGGMAMKELVNSREMKQYDKNTIEYYGIPSAVLMERAALSVFDEIKNRFFNLHTRILVVCGAGNNGGDGFAAARLLRLFGYPVEILFPMDVSKMTAETKAQYEAVQKYKIPKISQLKENSYDVIVDALFGIGLTRDITGSLRELIEELNEQKAYKIAVDIPSGVSTDDGRIMGAAFSADLTVTFGFAKIGQLLYPGAEYCGELQVKDIGIDRNSFLNQTPMGNYLDYEGVRELLPVRNNYSNKGSYGKVLVVAGSPRMAGAAYFSAKAACYSGCGLVRILTAEENREILLSRLPEAIITTYGADTCTADLLEECINWADAVLLGPGLGRTETSEFLVKNALKREEIPMVLDADALNILAEDMAVLGRNNSARVVTPHLGEMGRMISESVGDIQKNLLHTAAKFAEQYKVTCVLKDARTIISVPDGRFYVNITGNHGMATGGSGDVLAGLITGFLAQGLLTETAAVLACHLHGAAGDLAEKEKGACSMVASDILEQIPAALKRAAERGTKIR